MTILMERGMHMPPKINALKCIGCRKCVDSCPNSVLELIDGVSCVKFPENCEECGLCEAICEQGAIVLSH